MGGLDGFFGYCGIGSSQGFGGQLLGLNNAEVCDAFLGSDHIKTVFLGTEVFQEPFLG